jgi:hypothetical protein
MTGLALFSARFSARLAAVLPSLLAQAACSLGARPLYRRGIAAAWRLSFPAGPAEGYAKAPGPWWKPPNLAEFPG